MQAHRESTGTVTTTDDHIEDPVTAAEVASKFTQTCRSLFLSYFTEPLNISKNLAKEEKQWTNFGLSSLLFIQALGLS
jgi:hypothetical protein